MVNKILILIFSILLLSGCNLNNDNKNVNYPYKILEIINSKDKKASIVIIKTGVKSGSTVGFYYEFYITRNKNKLNKQNRFLWLKGLKKYTIKWTSINTIEITVQASNVLDFKSEIFEKPMSYFVTKFSWLPNCETVR